MKQELFDLAQRMLSFTNLSNKGFGVKQHEQNEKILFLTHDDQPQYELWEVSGLWNVSTVKKELVKKHEDFYFAFKYLLMQLVDKEMDREFDKTEETI